MKTLIQGIVFLVISFWLLLVIIVLHQMGWTGGYVLIAVSFALLAIGTEQLASWSVRNDRHFG